MHLTVVHEYFHATTAKLNSSGRDWMAEKPKCILCGPLQEVSQFLAKSMANGGR